MGYTVGILDAEVTLSSATGARGMISKLKNLVVSSSTVRLIALHEKRLETRFTFSAENFKSHLCN